MTNVTSAGAEAGLIDEFQTETSVPSSKPSENNVRFDDLGLSAEVLKAVNESGYTTPTPIQAQGIPHVLKRRDIIGIAQTGTGKTASFTLPMIELLARGRAKARMPRSLILEPTRELAAQVAESFERYGKYNKLSMALLIGGVSFEDQEKKLDRGVDVLIATPGRLLDHFERGKLMLSQVQILVVDEADRMLDMGFIPDVERICKLIPFTRQTLFYSATMPPEIQRLTEQFLHTPVRVEVARPATTAANITQEVVHVPNNDWAKREGLRRLIRECEADIKNAIVFCNRKRDVDIVAKSLIKHGFSAAPLHGDLDQSVRMKTLDAFKANEIKLLVASDVAARGLDIPAVSHIFNFDVPFHADDYVHRIGRTGRAGRSGVALMLATDRESKYVDTIEKLIGKPIARRTMEGIEVREDRGPRRDDRHRGRGGRDRDRERQRDRPIKPHGQVASMEPLELVAGAETPAQQPAPAAEHRPQTHRHEHREQKHHEPKHHEPRHHEQRQHEAKHHESQRHHAPKPAQKQQPRQPQQQQARADDIPDGSKLPAFLFRPVPLPKATEKPARPAKKVTAES